NTQEIAVKEKHKGAHTFWLAVNRLPLSSNAVLCWKFCHVFHKLLRDGHPNVSTYSRIISYTEGYGKLCSIYLKLLITKMEFHIKNPRFPGNLQMSNSQLDEAGENDVNNFFQLTVEMFDYLECELNLFLGVFSSLDMSRSVSVTAAGQCRLAPLIQVILDSSHLYDYTVKLLFKLHSCLPADTLQGHRDRFQEQLPLFYSFVISHSLNLFLSLRFSLSRLIQIPQLPENPPNFLRASALSEHISPVVVIPVESSSPESEHVAETEDLVDTDIPPLPVTYTLSLSKTLYILLLKGHVQWKRSENKSDTNHSFGLSQSGRLCQALRGRVNELEAELAEQTHLKQQALGESEFLRVELDDLRRVKEDTEKEQRSLSEIESKSLLLEQFAIQYTEFLFYLKYCIKVPLYAFSNITFHAVCHVAVCEHKLSESREQALESKLVSLRWAALRAALEEAGRIVQDSLNQLDDPAHISCTSSADYLVSRCQVALDCVERLQSARDDVSGLVRAVTQFAHLVGDVIVQGSATSHMVPVEQADALADNVKACGAEALALLCQLKEQKSNGTADCSRLRAALDTVMALGELRPRGLELQQGELGDLVEQEMAATSAAVESAAARIEEMLNKSRAVDTGIKMEVNERILASCTDLMQAIKVLVLSSKDLQRDIVESGRGAASMKEFYAKNSRWTEGLISASKAVGWGATMLVDAADQMVQGKGKFEELMVCSHEIAASTAQLVAASKVKADKDSPNLSRLQQASKGVTQATAGVVASTKSGKSQIEDTETMDFSAMTLTQIKRQEMDAQVLVLELETRLQKERERLGELRKKHYQLAGVAEGWGGEEEGKTPSKTTNICLSTTQYSLTISQNCFLLKNHPRVP
uniref:Huntingtin-interacting protein 1-like n=1 Tax=Sinocyclocheilus rhinocerous TaxID=307959 RepID=A0A673KIH6_9TELE